MPGPLQKPEQFKRRGRGLPGQSTDDDFGVGYEIKFVERSPALVLDKDMIQIGHLGSGRYIEITENGIRIYESGVLMLELQPDGDIFIGDTTSNRYMKLSTSGIQLYANGNLVIDLQDDGDVFFGQDVSDPAKTYFSIFANNQTYNSESVIAGDMLIGDNSAAKANILWDKSAGRLLFRGGQTTEAYIDTDGTITAGDGTVLLDSSGLALVAGTGVPNQINILDGSDVILKLFSQVDASTSQLEIVSQGKDSSNHEALFTLQAITDDGAAHAGAAQVYIQLDTANDVAEVEISRGSRSNLQQLANHVPARHQCRPGQESLRGFTGQGCLFGKQRRPHQLEESDRRDAEDLLGVTTLAMSPTIMTSVCNASAIPCAAANATMPHRFQWIHPNSISNLASVPPSLNLKTIFIAHLLKHKRRIHQE